MNNYYLQTLDSSDYEQSGSLTIRLSDSTQTFITSDYGWNNWEEYEDDLKRRQEEHLRNVRTSQKGPVHPCQHDMCSECVGIGIKLDGSMCVHHIYCGCPKCTPTYTFTTY